MSLSLSLMYLESYWLLYSKSENSLRVPSNFTVNVKIHENHAMYLESCWLLYSNHEYTWAYDASWKLLVILSQWVNYIPPYVQKPHFMHEVVCTSSKCSWSIYRTSSKCHWSIYCTSRKRRGTLCAVHKVEQSAPTVFIVTIQVWGFGALLSIRGFMVNHPNCFACTPGKVCNCQTNT